MEMYRLRSTSYMHANVRIGFLIGVIGVAGFIILGALLVAGRKSAATISEAANQVAGPSATHEELPLTVTRQLVPATVPTSVPKPQPDTSEQTGADAKSLAEWVSMLNDPRLSLEERKKAIQALAQLGSPEAVAALKAALATGNEDLRAAIAEGLGECASPECLALLLSLLNDPSQTVVQAAVRGLAQQGTPEAANALTVLLYDPSRPLDVRVEAALALGTMNVPGVMDTLSRAAYGITDEDIVTQVLNAIGQRDISESQPFLENYLRSPIASTDLKVEAVEALWQSQGDASAFLATIAANPDPDIRAAAAWALSATDEPGSVGSQLLNLLQREQDADVRLRLYQALGNQQDLDLRVALALVQQETNPSAQVAALGLLAGTVRENPNADVLAFFDQTAVAQLKSMALSGEAKDDRVAATMSLTRAGTPAAMAALQELAQQATDPRVLSMATRATQQTPPQTGP